jgi:hypothetical protein
MFKNGSSGCVDNSPEFLQDPYFISCAGDPYQYNMHAVDRDLDSIHVEFTTPLNNFPSGTFNPPTNPILIPFEPGFSYLSPTPTTAINPLNVAAAIYTAKQLVANNNNKSSSILRPKVVTIICDHGSRHLSRFWDPDYIAINYKLTWPPQNKDFIPSFFFD